MWDIVESWSEPNTYQFLLVVRKLLQRQEPQTGHSQRWSSGVDWVVGLLNIFS